MGAVVYVHGLWFPGHEAFLLRRRLVRERGYAWHTFHYSSTRCTSGEIADALDAFIARLELPGVHLLGHSLGGIAILRCLERHPRQPPGRVVFLGTPSLASHAAHSLARFRLGRASLGRAAREELLHAHERRWVHARELGIIAGTQPLSLGRLVTRFNEPNDGTVAVAETRLPGAKAHLSLPVSHSGLLLSARVAHEVGQFFETGQFAYSGDAPGRRK
jgi:pimeloyl-ACP methyl ester carboxylesterase